MPENRHSSNILSKRNDWKLKEYFRSFVLFGVTDDSVMISEHHFDKKATSDRFALLEVLRQDVRETECPIRVEEVGPPLEEY